MMPREIKAARVRAGYTQQQVADELGISVHTYRKKEAGSQNFSENEKFHVAELFGFDFNQLNCYLFDGKLTAFTKPAAATQ